MRSAVAAVLLIGASLALAADKPLTPKEARDKVGDTITVVMTVRATKDRLDKHGEIYLDAEEDFKDEKNFAVVLTRKGAAALKKAGIPRPTEYYLNKRIRASGTVKEVNDIPRIEINDAEKIGLEGKK